MGAWISTEEIEDLENTITKRAKKPKSIDSVLFSKPTNVFSRLLESKFTG